MRPEPRSDSDGGSEPGWSVVERGSFLFGRCAGCGFHSAGRRARYSVESDMRAHEVLCHATEELPVAAEASKAPEPSNDPAPEPVG